MCGLAGFYSQQGNEALLQQMTNTLQHRGPDAAGYFYDPATGVGLGHRRLSIIDTSAAANQPMRSASGHTLAVFNGEVFNYRDIAKQLHRPMRTSSDTEVLLEAFEQWGPEFIHRCNGMYVLVLYQVHEQRLWVFRDRMGIKPLYYSYQGGQFFFGSELKALRTALPQLSINQTALQAYLHLGYVPAPHSIHNEVHKFPQGHYARIDASGMQITPYWQLKEQIEPAHHVLCDEAKATDALDALLQDAIGLRLISDVPLGCLLSGGIDSSLVTAMAQRLQGQPMNTFSIGMIEKGKDESQYAAAVAKQLGTHHHAYQLTEEEMLARITQLPGIYDEPFADSSAIPTLMVSQMAREKVTVALSGDGGDELFLGYGMYTWAQRMHNPVLHALRHSLAWVLQQSGDQRLQRGALVLQYANKQSRAAHIFSQEQYNFSLSEIRALTGTIYTAYPKLHQQLARELNAAEAQALYDLQYYLPDELLVKVDRASMHHSLELRVPLLDYRLVHFALNLQSSLRKKGSVHKHLLKQVLYRYIPAHLFNRPKQGFSIPEHRWLSGILRQEVITCLQPEAVASTGLVAPAAVQRLLHAYFHEGKQYLSHRVWTVWQLHKWAQQFMHAHKPTPAIVHA